MQIAKNTVVMLTFELLDAQGNVIEKTDDPIAYLHGGYHGIFPLVEQALDGKAAGHSCKVRLAPEDAFALAIGERALQLLLLQSLLQMVSFLPGLVQSLCLVLHFLPQRGQASLALLQFELRISQAFRQSGLQLLTLLALRFPGREFGLQVSPRSSLRLGLCSLGKKWAPRDHDSHPRRLDWG